MAFDPKYTDPVVRFQKALAMARRGAPTPNALAPGALASVIQNNPADVSASLATHIAQHSFLDEMSAANLVDANLPTLGTTQDKATAVSAAATSATSVTALVELSDPVMLWPGARFVFAGALVLTLVLALVFIFVLTQGSTNVATAAYASLAAVAGLSLVGMLVLVMGYKNVTIKGGTPSI
jgi:hypothetical protein